MPRIRPLVFAAAAFTSPVLASALKFDFGSGAVAPGYTAVAADTLYSRERGFGFEAGAKPVGVNRRAADSLRSDFITSDSPFHFTARVPHEGNYRVRVTLGDAEGESVATVKAELRRLMAEKVVTRRGEFETLEFIVNTRTPRIAAVNDIKPGEVRLKAPRETTDETWAWDDAITIEFSNTRPAVCAIEIEPVEVPTIFLLGDSTVCDQAKEPFNSWGQMLPRWFTPRVALANHGESGETYRDSLARRRLDKILSVMKPGDWLLLQFGHNDQKQIAANTGGPFTTYKAELKRHIEGAQARSGIPVVISPMERRRFDDEGRPVATLAEYAEAARQSAEELGVAFIDLNAMSRRLYQALGPDRSALAFAAPGGKVDNTHHNNYGSYQLAKCIVQALREQKLPLAEFIVADFPTYDPARPDNPDTFAVPASSAFTNQRPLGD